MHTRSKMERTVQQLSLGWGCFITSSIRFLMTTFDPANRRLPATNINQLVHEQSPAVNASFLVHGFLRWYSFGSSINKMILKLLDQGLIEFILLMFRASIVYDLFRLAILL